MILPCLKCAGKGEYCWNPMKSIVNGTEPETIKCLSCSGKGYIDLEKEKY